MDKFNIKALIHKVESKNVEQKIVERKIFEDYLLDKHVRGKYRDNFISFEDEDDFAYFEKVCNNLDIDIADFMSIAR
ncbi:MAG: hypothetical protein K6G92_04135 [Bacteroidaceae bacterium]|nr:hypothetical protein [Bacteroidaceae bacterium]